MEHGIIDVNIKLRKDFREIKGKVLNVGDKFFFTKYDKKYEGICVGFISGKEDCGGFSIGYEEIVFINKQGQIDFSYPTDMIESIEILK